MEKRIVSGKSTLVAGALIAIAGLTANASGLISFNKLGSGEEVRARLLENKNSKAMELACGGKSKTDTTAKKGKDGKCGEGKCGGAKTDSTGKKGKDGKCGEGKCGSTKKKNG